MTKDEYVELIHRLPCVVHYLRYPRAEWLETVAKVQAHHLEEIRHSYSDWGTVPFCRDHHNELHVHVGGGSRREFERRYKLDDVKLLEATIKLVIFYLGVRHGGMGKALAAGADPRAIFRRLQ